MKLAVSFCYLLTKFLFSYYNIVTKFVFSLCDIFTKCMFVLRSFEINFLLWPINKIDLTCSFLKIWYNLLWQIGKIYNIFSQSISNFTLNEISSKWKLLMNLTISFRVQLKIITIFFFFSDLWKNIWYFSMFEEFFIFSCNQLMNYFR